MLIVSWKAVTLERTRLSVITGDSYISMSTLEKAAERLMQCWAFCTAATLVTTIIEP